MRTNQEGNTVAARLTILRDFTEMKREQLDLHVFFEAVGNEPANRERVLDAVEELQSEGLIESRSGDLYSLTARGVEGGICAERDDPSRRQMSRQPMYSFSCVLSALSVTTSLPSTPAA